MGRFLTVALVATIALMGVGAGTPAEAISCVGAGDVTLLGPAGCTEGGLTFTDFSVTVAGFTGGATIFLSTDTTSIGQAVNLNYQVAHDPSPVSLADIIFTYSVTGGPGQFLNGIDIANPGQNVTIREVVCGDPFVAGVCGSGILANLVAGPNSILAANFDPDSTIFIRKDMQFGNDSFISEFTQSHDITPVPEPATLVLLGTTLAGLGMASRRRLRKKAAQAS